MVEGGEDIVGDPEAYTSEVGVVVVGRPIQAAAEQTKHELDMEPCATTAEKRDTGRRSVVRGSLMKVVGLPVCQENLPF